MFVRAFQYLRFIIIQLWNGFPVYPGIHVHIGTWFIVWHCAFNAHVPGHGSWHLFCWQTLSELQSVLTVHSGRHPSYGLPKYPGGHIQDPAWLCSLQMALLPHGDGVHGFVLSIRKASSIRQPTKGSPVEPGGHIHIGVWLTTRQRASDPQAPTQGSEHFLFIQAKLFAHSLLLAHSGRQFGGVPIYSEIHEHDGVSFIFWHTEFGPHGVGTQGLTWGE